LEKHAAGNGGCREGRLEQLPLSIRSFIQEYCTTKITKVKEKFAKKFMKRAPEITPRRA
jgi:hypothetical protein